MSGTEFPDLERAAEARQMARERADDLKQAKHLATILWERHYRDEAPQWKVGKNMSLVLSQIDNMTAGMIRNGGGHPSDDETDAFHL